MYIKSTKYNNQSRNHKLFLKYISYQVTKLTRSVQTFIYFPQAVNHKTSSQESLEFKKGEMKE